MQNDDKNSKNCLFPSTSLFCSADISDKINEKNDEPKWLKNESFIKNVNSVNKLNDSLNESNEKIIKKDSKLVSKEKKLRRKSVSPEKNLIKKLKKKSSSPEKNLIKTKQYVKGSIIENNDLFQIDTRYIKDNFLYDGLYIGDLPRYKISESFFNKRKHSKNKIRYFKSKLLESVFLNKLNKNQSSILNDNFVPLIIDEISKNNKIKNEEKNLDDKINYDENNVLYKKIKDYNSYLNNNPNDIKKWIEFINFQDEVVFEIEAKNDINKKTNDVYLIEKKIAILEKALNKNSSNLKLMILKLDLLKKIQEPDILNEEWKKLLFIHPTNFEIIKSYIKFIISHISFFNLNNLNNFFSKHMEKIIQYQEGHLQSIRSEYFDKEKSMLELIYFYTIILKQCGYIEKSIAIWQALIEFNFYKLDILNNETTLEDWKDYFEPFWSSNEPKFGEKNFIGWKSSFEKKKSLPNKTEIEKLKILNEKENDLIKKHKKKTFAQLWFEIEILRENLNWEASKPNDNIDDLDNVVSFENISYCLFRFKDKKSFFNCLIYFLTFLNAIKISSLLPELVIDDQEQISNNIYKSLIPEYFNYKKFFKFKIFIFQKSLDLIEDQIEDYHKLVNYYFDFLNEAVQQNNLDAINCKKLFKQILKKSINCNILSLWQKFVNLEVQENNLISAEKIYTNILETLIKQNFNLSSLSIINDYIEFKLNIKVTNENFLKIKSFNEEKEIGEKILIFIYSAINIKTIDDFKQINAIMQLRTSQKIEQLKLNCLEQVDKIKHDFSDINFDQQVEYNNLIYLIVLQIYINYFNFIISSSTNLPSRNLVTSLKVFEDNFKIIKNISNKKISNYLKEKLIEKVLDFNIFHLEYNFGSLKTFNDLLNQGLKINPKNSKFLDLLVKTEYFRFTNQQIKKYTINLYQNIHETTLKQWVYVINFEIQRLSNINSQPIQSCLNYKHLIIDQTNEDFEKFKSSSELNKNYSKDVDTNDKKSSHSKDYKKKAFLNLNTIDHTGTYCNSITIRIRNLFEKALNVHNCLLLWRMYIHFEINQNDLTKAKIIFYRAVQQCPWSRLLYLDGIKLFTLMNSSNQNINESKNTFKFIKNVHSLNDIIDLMNEKQIRVRTAIEEIEFLVENYKKLS